jgi:hypothetical protein
MAIVPDDKDWTWVLERPCPECGFDAREVTPQLIPALLRDLVKGWQRILLREDVGERPVRDKWSPLEYSCHVRDVFRLFDERLQLMVAHDGARFENWDQDATAIENRYDLQDPRVVSRELSQAGEELARHYAQVDGPEWKHRGLRSNGSEFTVETFGVYLVHDPIHHLWDVSGSRSDL